MLGLGLSVVLEAQSQSQRGGSGTGYGTSVNSNSNTKRPPPQIISKISMIKSSPSSPTFPSPPSPSWRRISSPAASTNTSGFLDHCYLCKQKLLPAKDIFMYKGDRAFCSVECRYRQIFMDEEECVKVEKNNYCSLAALKPPQASSASS